MWELVIYGDAPYLLGRRPCHEEPVLRTYAVDRMSEVEIDRATRLESPAGFDPADHFGDLGLWKPRRQRERLEVLFSGEIEPLAEERTWHASAESSETWDGRHRLILDIRISPEVESWLLDCGVDVVPRGGRPPWVLRSSHPVTTGEHTTPRLEGATTNKHLHESDPRLGSCQELLRP